MLNTFDENNNEMMLAAIQELTADLATAQSKIAELENGGGGGGATTLEYRYDYTNRIINPNDFEYGKLSFLKEASESGNIKFNLISTFLSYQTIDTTTVPGVQLSVYNDDDEEIILPDGTYTIASFRTDDEEIHTLLLRGEYKGYFVTISQQGN